VHFQRVRPRALSSGSHSYGPPRIDPTNEICSLPVHELQTHRSNSRGGSRRIHRSTTHVTSRFRVSEVLVAPTHNPPDTRTPNSWIRGARGVNSRSFPIANDHDNPWLLPDGSRPSVLRTRKTFPFRYFHITIFLSSHPERVRDLGLEIHTARGSGESILFRRMVSGLHDLSYLDHFTTYAREALRSEAGHTVYQWEV
jgi:hypothetical protein